MNAPDHKPDPEAHARVILWHLAEIRATVRILQAHVLARERDPESPESMMALVNMNEMIRKVTEGYYQQGLQHSKIPPSSEFPPPSVGSDIFGIGGAPKQE